MSQESNIYEKLRIVSEKIGVLSKDMENPFFKSKYLDINKLLKIVQPVLRAENLFLSQPITNNEQCTVITCTESGDSIVSSIQLSDIKDPQKRGSEITYFRRYTLIGLLGLEQEDDDGNLNNSINTDIEAIKLCTNEEEFIKVWKNVENKKNERVINESKKNKQTWS